MITTEDCDYLQLYSVHMKTNPNAEVELHREPRKEKAVLRSTKKFLVKSFPKVSKAYFDSASLHEKKESQELLYGSALDRKLSENKQ